MSRAEIARRVDELARLYGWLHHHHEPREVARYVDGFPTEILVRDGHLVFLTVGVGAGGRVGPTERRWLDALTRAAKIDALLVQPGNFAPVTRLLTEGHR